eukprot:TRINITY_DN15412_c0_g1_i1.p1 TRINITY_DN15412_c0_g1~~TRINITY_DN15412_c0_g1_i1.p1  ORF type:complete len:116 (-),score=8.93 TRINITY_DN15412_c0_g1_i1:251-598(-)
MFDDEMAHPVVNALVSGTVLFSMAGGPVLLVFGTPALLWRLYSMSISNRFIVSLSCFVIGLGYRLLERKLPPPALGDGGFHGLLQLWQYGFYILGGIFTGASAIFSAVEVARGAL